MLQYPLGFPLKDSGMLYMMNIFMIPFVRAHSTLRGAHIDIIRIFFLFKKIPQIPKRKRIIENVKYFTRSIIIVSLLKANSVEVPQENIFLSYFPGEAPGPE